MVDKSLYRLHGDDGDDENALKVERFQNDTATSKRGNRIVLKTMCAWREKSRAISILNTKVSFYAPEMTHRALSED